MAASATRWVAAALVAGLIAIAAINGCGAEGVSKPAAQIPAVDAAAPPLRPLRVAGPRPNIVFVLTDDLSWNLIPYMPHVRQMQRDGATFTNYYVTDSLCCPSRASIFTGRFPHDTGIYTNNGPDGGFDAFHLQGEEADTFALMLQRAGYQTALMGKYLNGYDPASTEGGSRPYVPPGWNEWDVAGNAYREFNYSLNENGHLVHYGSSPQAYLTDVLADKGTSFVDGAAAAGEPFMLEVATFAPHSPFVPAPRDSLGFPGLQAPRTPAFNAATANAPAWLSNYAPLTARMISRIDRGFRRRAQSVQAVDALIGRLEAEVAKRHIADNTYFVFSSDNGLHMGEHRLLPGKLTAYDTDIRVPLIVVGPHVAPGTTLDQLTQNTDIAPTFLRLAGIVPPPTVEGRSLVPLLGGGAAGWRDAVLIEHHGRVTDPNDPDLPSAGAGNPPTYEAIRRAQSLYVEYANGEREYYDLTRDPYELDNVYLTLPPTAQASLHAILTATESCHDAGSCWSAAHAAG